MLGNVHVPSPLNKRSFQLQFIGNMNKKTPQLRTIIVQQENGVGPRLGNRSQNKTFMLPSLQYIKLNHISFRK